MPASRRRIGAQFRSGAHRGVLLRGRLDAPFGRADAEGRPWSERKKMVWWDDAAGEWSGTDIPDFEKTKRPDYRPDWSKHPQGMDALGGDGPFIMETDGKSMLFVPSGLKDGPLPAHHEPVETPVKNPMYDQQRNPTAKLWTPPGNELHEVGDPRFPYVLTTFRLTELHCGGIIGRVVPHMAELQPEPFVEVPPELAIQLGITHMNWTVLSTLRGEVEMRAMVTDRVRPFQVDGRTIYQIGVPWVFGWQGYARGDIANVLLAITGDANTSIHSTKAVTCGLRPGRTRQAAVAAE